MENLVAKKSAQEVTLLTCVTEVPCSKLGRDTNILSVFVVFPRPLSQMPDWYFNLENDHFDILLNSLFTTIEPFDCVQFALLIVLLIKLQMNTKEKHLVYCRHSCNREFAMSWSWSRPDCQQLRASTHLATSKHLENICFPFRLNTGGISRPALSPPLLLSIGRKCSCHWSEGLSRHS
jgi:hypothetical protein